TVTAPLRRRNRIVEAGGEVVPVPCVTTGSSSTGACSMPLARLLRTLAAVAVGIFLGTPALAAQGTGTVTGVVVNAENGLTLAGVALEVPRHRAARGLPGRRSLHHPARPGRWPVGAGALHRLRAAVGVGHGDARRGRP